MIPSIAALIASSFADEPPPPDLEVGALIAAATETTTAETIATAPVTVAEGDRLVACLAHRTGLSVRTHDSITSAGWTATWTKRPDQPQEDTTGSSTTRASMWDGVVTAAGTGAATGTLSGTSFQRALLLIRVPGMAAVDQQAAGSNEVGTTVSAAWASAPNAAALGIAYMAAEGVPATMGVTDLTPIADTNLSMGTSFQVRAFQKLGSLPSPLAGTGAVNDRGKILVGLSVVGA